MVVATLMENDPETGERLDLQEVAKQLEGIRAKYENEKTGVHIIGFAKAVGDIAEGRGRRARVLRHRLRDHGAAALLVFRAR